LDIQLYDPPDGPEGQAENARSVDPKAETPEPGRKGRKPGDSPDWRPLFLKNLRAWDGLERAAYRAGVNPTTVRRERKRNGKFNQRVERTLELRKQWLDKMILKRGIEGSDRCLLAHARAHMPDLYGRRDPRPSESVKPITQIEIILPGPPKPEPILGGPVRELPAGGGAGQPARADERGVGQAEPVSDVEIILPEQPQ
jgi:hypothetical protein